MLNYVIYYVKLCDLVIFLAIIVLEWYLLSFLMTIIVFLFYYRGGFGFGFGFEFECEFESELEFESGMLGSVDCGGSTTRCQSYQHKWLSLLVVMYSTIL